MQKAQPAWRTYEEVARFLLEQFAAELGVSRVEGKQHLQGTTGTTWEIDGKAALVGGVGFLVVECRRTDSLQRQSQAKLGSLAFTIQDVGASGGIIVSPLELQKGAAIVAAAKNIVPVRLTETSTAEEYVLQFLNQVMVGIADRVEITDSLEVEVSR
jgi:hypothetical protein